jgi:tRNA(Arg) A34 adenosine deaminase TadA
MSCDAFMDAALEQARLALGCRRGADRRRARHRRRDRGAAFNQPISSCDPTAHAEVLVVRERRASSATTA